MTLRMGFVGLGDIGAPIASHLVAAGFETTVYDLREDAMAELVAGGAKAAGSPRQVAESSDVIGVCVPEDDHVRQVMGGEDGLLAGAAPGSVIAVHSTILPSTVLEVARAAAEREVGVLDACVTGGAGVAREGGLTYLVGGDAALLQKARPYLECSSTRTLHAGELGNGCKLKLCINVISYLQWAAAYESALLAKAVGLPQEVLEEAGRANGQITDLMARYLALHKAPEEARKSEAMQRMLRGYMHVAEKDLAWALRLAREGGVTLPAAALVSQLMGRIYMVEDPDRR